MPEITQKLGFEASGAITTINEMSASLAGLNTQITNFNKATSASGAGKIAAGLDKTAKSAGEAATAVTDLGNKTKEAGKKGADAAQKFTISWGGLVKALIARTAVQAITATIGALKNAVDEASKFQIEVAKISNIAKGPAGEIDALTESLSELSVSLGRDISEVSTAAFEALQNDLGTTTETMKLLEGSAHNLALVTGGTLEQAVNSISSVIKAFNIDISKANEISDTFFQAIDSGRITLEEFQSSLGRVAPLAGVLGVTFEETAASIAAITQAGTTARVAQTQLRNVLQKMLDPTDKLKEAFRQLGFATGKELIQATGGLIPALQQLATIADVGSQEFADFFGTIRGTLGSLNLLGNEAAIVTKIMGQMEEKTGRAAKAAAEIEGVDAREAAKSMEELNRTLRELGESFLKVKIVAIDTLNNVIGSAAEAKIVMGTLATAAVAVGAAFLVFGTAAAVAVTPILLGAAAIGSWIIAGKKALELFDLWSSKSDRAAKFMEDFNKQIAEVEFAKQKQLAEEAAKAQIDAVEGFVKTASAEYKKLSDKVKATQESIQQSVKSTIKAFVGEVKGLIGDITKQLEGLDEAAKTARQSAIDVGKEIEKIDFENSLRNMTEQQKIEARRNETLKASAKLQELANNADGTKENTKAIKDQVDLVRDLSEAYVDAAEDSKNAFNIQQSGDFERKTLKSIEKAWNATADSIEQHKRELQDETSNQAIIDLQTLADAGKEVGKLDVGAEGYAEAVDSFKAALEDVDRTALEKLGQADQYDSIVSTFKSKMNELKLEWNGARESLQAKLLEAKFKAIADVSEGVGETGSQTLDTQLEQAKKVEGPESLAVQNKLLQEFVVAQEEAIRARDKLSLAVGKTNEQLIQGNDLIRDAVNFGETSASNAENIIQNLGNLQEQINTAKQIEGQGFQTRLDQALSDAAKLESEQKLSTSQLEAIQSQIETLKTLVTEQEKRIAQEKLIDPVAVENALLEIDKITKEAAKIEFGAGGLDKLDQDTKAVALSATDVANNMDRIMPIMRNIGTDSGTLATNTQTVSTNTNLITTAVDGLTQGIGAAIAAMNQLAAAAARAAKAAAAAKQAASGAKYHGGKVAYRAAGGVTRGQDTQLTALAAGEHVTNAQNTRKFFSQLQAINAGQSPQQRDKGGPVTNIGDINVQVSSESADPQLGRSIASELRRELRRQTSTF